MPTSSSVNKKKPCIAAKTTDTSSCQTFHYASHFGVVSFASPLVQQHCPFCQSSCLGHHPQDVLGGRQHGAHPSWPGKTPSVHSQTWGPCSPCRAAAAAAAANGIFCVVDITKHFFLLLRQKNFLCPGELSILVTQRSFSWAWCLA